MQKEMGRSLTVFVFLYAMISSILFFQCRCSFADPAHPSKGSIEFGAAENPVKSALIPEGSFKTIFADIAEKVVPTVVSVIITKIDTVVYNNNPFYQFFNDPFSDGDPLQYFFGAPPPENRGKQRRPPPVEKKEFREQGLGSGVIISKNGYILTNFHVVSGASEIAIKLYNGHEYQASIVGSDSLSDVAVVKLMEEVNDLPVAYIGNSDNLRPGDWVLAVGNPFSLTSTVTAGIVSAINRAVEGGQRYQNFIQTDAAINPGNSGGALVNIEGELIGINTMIYSSSGGNMGIGFAIPLSMARKIMEQIIFKGEVTRGWIGVSIQDIDQATRDDVPLIWVRRKACWSAMYSKASRPIRRVSSAETSFCPSMAGRLEAGMSYATWWRASNPGRKFRSRSCATAAKWNFRLSSKKETRKTQKCSHEEEKEANPKSGTKKATPNWGSMSRI